MENSLFAVYAEVDGIEKPLILSELTFGRLIDDIVVPYQLGQPFFIDGVVVKAEKLKRIKILLLNKKHYEHYINKFNRSLDTGTVEFRTMYGEQYNVRLEHILRFNSEDVTSQILKAYDQAIKPKIQDYLPNRSELISSATQIFTESIKLLGSS
ncbi:hypothetical protein ACVW8L_004492 [Vibrio parahaemolyticus]|nr:hypothetical protein [Vibrio parahaemolyticus]MBM4923899.1 hypothetical protein [Vibrio parahaemolyticus]